MRKNRQAFTLVELLVVIGIIAVLIGILLPALSKAREQANTIKCASNLRGIGQSFAQYVSENDGTFPPSNFYTGLQLNAAGGTQSPGTPYLGYTHWSALISGNGRWEAASDYIVNNQPPSLSAPQLAPFLSTSLWGQFQCPSLINGGLPPANTWPANNDLGITNESPGEIDIQAPRLAYTVNEALCPRSYFIRSLTLFPHKVLEPYHFVRAGEVAHSANTILATELWGFQLDALTSSATGASNGPVSNSRRPVSGYISPPGSPDQLYGSLTGIYSTVTSFYWPNPCNGLTPDPETTLQAEYAASGTYTVNSTLDFVGRNHGRKTLGTVAGSTLGGWDLRTTNFLYVDGHVETKSISQTVYPSNQWGDEMYSLQN